MHETEQGADNELNKKKKQGAESWLITRSANCQGRAETGLGFWGLLVQV